MKSVLRFFAFTIQIAGVVVLVYCSFVLVRAHTFQAYANWIFDRSLRNNQTDIQYYPYFASTSNRTARKLDSLIGRIEIPRLQLSTMILEGDEERQLQLGAGHVPGTALPGHVGNTVIAAHRDTFFRPLQKISKNDQITLTTLGGSFQYTVESIEIINPDNTAVLQPTAEPTLTLVTCYPFTFVGQAPQRFVVRAKKVGSNWQGIHSSPEAIKMSSSN